MPNPEETDIPRTLTDELKDTIQGKVMDRSFSAQSFKHMRLRRPMLIVDYKKSSVTRGKSDWWSWQH